jgi:hypothetical protein
MHYLFQSWFATYYIEALGIPFQKILSEMTGLTDRTLRNYNKKPKSDFLKLYTKLMKGFIRMGAFKGKAADAHIEILQSGEFKGFYYESLYARIQLEYPEVLRFIHYSASFFDSWSQLADHRNIPPVVFLDDKQEETLDWMKNQYPYSEFDINILFEIYKEERSASDEIFINLEIGFSMLVAMNMDFYTASNLSFKEDDLANLIMDSFRGEKIVSLWFQRIRDEYYHGSKEEFYKEYSKNSILEKAGELTPMDELDAKRVYIRMCKKGKADWVQIGRISNTLCKDEPTLYIVLALRFALLKSIEIYTDKVKKSGELITEETYLKWTHKWAQNFTMHSPPSSI